MATVQDAPPASHSRALQDKDRIFTNLYGHHGADLKSAMKYGDWYKTKEILEKHHDWHVKRGAYVPKDPALALAMTLGRRYRDSPLQFVDRYVGAMAVELSVDEHDLRMCLDTHMRLHFERTIRSIRDDAVVTGGLDDELEAEARGHVAEEA